MFNWIWNEELNCYCAEHNLTIRADGEGNVFGGGSTTIQQPSTPAAPTTTSSIEDWVKNYPAVFALQKEYAPQEAAQQVQLAQQYAQPLGEAYKTAQEAMYPGTTALQEQLAGQAQAGIESGVPDWMRQQYQSDLRANLGTNAGSGIGADYTSRGLLQQQQDWQNYYRDLGLSVTGRQPLAQAQTQRLQVTDSQFTPNSVMGYNSSNYGNYANAYTSMYNTNANTAAQGNASWMNIIGSGLGAAGTAAGGYFLSSRRFKENIKLWA